MRTKIIISILIVLISSLNYIISEDSYKFLLLGRSATYGIILEKNNITLITGLILVGAIFFLKNNRYKFYLVILFSSIWIFSLHTKAIDKERNKYIYGILFFKVYETELKLDHKLFNIGSVPFGTFKHSKSLAEM